VIVVVGKVKEADPNVNECVKTPLEEVILVGSSNAAPVAEWSKADT